MKGLLIFRDPLAPAIPKEASYLKLWRICATAEFSFQAMISLLSSLIIFFGAQGTQRHFWPGCISCCTEMHRFYPIFEGFCFQTSSYQFKKTFSLLWCSVFSSLGYKDLQFGREDSHHPPYLHKGSSCHTSASQSSTADTVHTAGCRTCGTAVTLQPHTAHWDLF